MVSYETPDVDRANTAEFAYALLEQTLSGDTSVFVADEPSGFNIWSGQAQEMLTAAGFSWGGRTYIYSFGDGGYAPQLGFHADGSPGSDPVQGIHVHETPSGLAKATFVPMRRKRSWLADYVNWEKKELDPTVFEPRVFRTIVGIGAVAVFSVAGRNALAHSFESMPDELAYREATINTFHRS